MRKLFLVIPLVFLFCFTFGCQRQVEEVAEEPVVDVAAEKEAVAETLQNLVDAAVNEDMEGLKKLWHPQITWWNYTQDHPVGMDVYPKEMEDLFKSEVEWVSCDAKPVEIHVVDNVAILYINNKNTFKDAEGNEFTTIGPWTAVLIKEAGKWLFLSNSWTVNE